MKIISWNVNGLSAISKKINFQNFVTNENPDILCLQEIKCTKEQCAIDGYNAYWSFSTKKGYSGTVIFSKYPAVSILHPNIDNEGRITAIELETCIIVSVYVPNSQRNLEKLGYRLEWDTKFREWLSSISKETKNTIICGDFNVSQTELDIAEPKKHTRHPGFTNTERLSFAKLLENFVDAYRSKYPDSKAFTFWSYLGSNFLKDIGYRCDLFLVDKRFFGDICDVSIMKNIRASDHCPIVLVTK